MLYLGLFLGVIIGVRYHDVLTNFKNNTINGIKDWIWKNGD